MIGLFRALALALVATVAPAMAQLRVDDRWDFRLSVRLEPGQGAILVGFRRPDEMSAGKSGAVAFARYDPARRDLILQPRHADDAGDTTTYWVLARSGDRQLDLDYALMVVSAGDYVLYGASPGPTRTALNTFCLGAPTFRLNAGEIVYFGDVTPYINVRMADGRRASAMAYSSHPEDARAHLAEQQPGLAALLRPAELRNGATYGCGGQEMLAYAVPGAPEIGSIAATASEPRPDGRAQPASEPTAPVVTPQPSAEE
jgi:hypothetical protein